MKHVPNLAAPLGCGVAPISLLSFEVASRAFAASGAKTVVASSGGLAPLLHLQLTDSWSMVVSFSEGDR